MFAKPFQPPSRKKPQPDSSDNAQPAKRRRVGSDDYEAKTSQGSGSFARAVEAHRLSNQHLESRKPLLPIRNSTSGPSQNDAGDGEGVEGFYNVLWYEILYSWELHVLRL